MDLTQFVRDIPDFPQPGIIFKDICPLIGNHVALSHALDSMVNLVTAEKLEVDTVVGIESRGFIFAPGIAERLGVGFVPMRKPGKLPWQTHSVDYGLEYGKDRIEVQTDAFEPGQRVLLVDDVLATGGTIEASAKLCRQAGATPIAAVFLIGLSFLNGSDNASVPCHSVLNY